MNQYDQTFVAFGARIWSDGGLRVYHLAVFTSKYTRAMRHEQTWTTTHVAILNHSLGWPYLDAALGNTLTANPISLIPLRNPLI